MHLCHFCVCGVLLLLNRFRLVVRRSVNLECVGVSHESVRDGVRLGDHHENVWR